MSTDPGGFLYINLFPHLSLSLSLSPFWSGLHSDPPARSSAVSDSGQSRREKFRQQKQKEMEVDVLQNIMKFVEDFLRNPSIWIFENKEQNLLIYEVRGQGEELNIEIIYWRSEDRNYWVT